MNKLFKFIIPFIVQCLLLTVCCSIFTAKGQQPITSEGKDFWFAFIANDIMHVETETLDVYITSEFNTTGTISLPLKSWSQAFSVSANNGIVLEVPDSLASSVSSEIIEQKGIHIISDSNITVWAFNCKFGSSDGSNILPTTTIGENPEYLVASYSGLNQESSEFLLVSLEDSTEISITPITNTQGGKSANVPFNIILNKGETYQVMAQGTDDFTGSSVKTVKGSITLFSGTACADIPVGCASCDLAYKQCFPIKSWGKEFILTPFMNQIFGYVYRVIASEDTTTVTIPGHIPILLNKGGVYTDDTINPTAIYVSAEKPISVIQFMKGNGCNGYGGSDGDPSMLILNSNNQILKFALFESATPPLINEKEFLNILTGTVNTDSIIIDGTRIDKTNFIPVPSLNTWSYANFQINSGLHSISSNGGFIAYAYGLAPVESYIYTVGGEQNSTCNSVAITTQPADVSVCNTGSASFSVTVTGDATISYQWQVSPGWTNLSNSIMYSGVSTSALKVTNPTASLQYRCIASNCLPKAYATSNTAILTLISSVAINPSFYNQSQCLDSSIAFTLNPAAGTAPFSYQWLLNENTILNATNFKYQISNIKNADSGKYSCIISNICNSVTGNAVSLTPVICNRTHHTISGYVTYDNKTKTPLSSKFDSTTTEVLLYNSKDTLITTTQTDDNGYYFFVNIINGSYYVSGSTKKEWGGSNPTDALIVNRNYIGLYHFTDNLLYQAGDVDSSGTLNPTDALIINRRYIGLLTKYSKVKDWKFQKIKVEMDGVDLSQDIKAVCSGDVNASYAPYLIPGKMTNTPVNISGSLNITPGKQFDIPVYLNDNIELGAIGLKLKIQNQAYKILDVKSDIDGLLLNIRHSKFNIDEIDIAWSATDEGINITPNKPIFYITSIYNGDPNLSSFQIPDLSIELSLESELADIDVNLINTDKLFIPQLILSTQHSALFTVFPNPFTNTTNIVYHLPEDLYVKLNIFNVLGENFITLVNTNQKAGQYTIKYNGSNLKQGIYYCRIEATNKNSTYTKTNIMIVTR